MKCGPCLGASTAPPRRPPEPPRVPRWTSSPHPGTMGCFTGTPYSRSTSSEAGESEGLDALSAVVETARGLITSLGQLNSYLQSPGSSRSRRLCSPAATISPVKPSPVKPAWSRTPALERALRRSGQSSLRAPPTREDAGKPADPHSRPARC